MEFTHVTIRIKDLEKSLEFYHGILGLGIVRRSPPGAGAKLAFLGLPGQPTVELIESAEMAPFSGFSIGFTVDSLAESTAEMEKAGYPLVRGPISPNPQVKFSFFHDPDGVEVQLLENVKA